MWNERLEMLEDPKKMKLFYTSDEVVPKPCQPLIDVYKKMKEAECLKCKCPCETVTKNK